MNRRQEIAMLNTFEPYVKSRGFQMHRLRSVVFRRYLMRLFQIKSNRFPGVDNPKASNVQHNGGSPERKQRKRLCSAVLTLGIAGTLISGCGSSAKSSSSTTTTPPTTVTADGKVLADYRAFWDMYLAVSNPVKVDDPRLPAHATGDELQLLVQQLNLAKSDGNVWKGTVDLKPLVVDVSADKATVRDCLLDNTGAYKVSDGSRVDSPDASRQLDVFDMRLIDGTWKVNLITKERDGCTEP